MMPAGKRLAIASLQTVSILADAREKSFTLDELQLLPAGTSPESTYLHAGSPRRRIPAIEL
jgi:hypothetical protein